uniref:Uncharacterized protein n=1 Tax=Dulem virus 40 TaxID=3145758 RepID=A0AAU8AXZ5_9CAUD
MKFSVFAKWYSSYGRGAALGCASRHDWGRAMLYVVFCAVNHFCYIFHTKRCRKP